MRKLFAGLLAAVLALGMGGVAWAAYPIEIDSGSSIPLGKDGKPNYDLAAFDGLTLFIDSDAQEDEGELTISSGAPYSYFDTDIHNVASDEEKKFPLRITEAWKWEWLDGVLGPVGNDGKTLVKFIGDAEKSLSDRGYSFISGETAVHDKTFPKIYSVKELLLEDIGAPYIDLSEFPKLKFMLVKKIGAQYEPLIVDSVKGWGFRITCKSESGAVTTAIYPHPDELIKDGEPVIVEYDLNDYCEGDFTIKDFDTIEVRFYVDGEAECVYPKLPTS
jgi:hypothetical protein